jgi:hypothetical protein
LRELFSVFCDISQSYKKQSEERYHEPQEVETENLETKAANSISRLRKTPDITLLPLLKDVYEPIGP